MSYPTLEQYNEAFQYPHLALADSELGKGRIVTTGLGLPLALCGGFALTYTINVGNQKYAVRCFHKHSKDLEKRYSAISRHIQSLSSPYFVKFEFQSQGIRVASKSFPVVKMAWASGITLGEFLENNYRNSTNLHNLLGSLKKLAEFLESHGMAHGDIQPGNVMVADAGNTIQLIDYDGIFVDELKSLGSAELGHRNFQHPKRVSSSWDTSLDRFSFINLDLAIRALSSHPELWTKTGSDGDSILFKANDFADPSRSSIFCDLFGIQNFEIDAKNFAAICCSPFAKIPTFEDFRARRNIPVLAITVSSTMAAKQYLSAFKVLDATNYSVCLNYVGEKVELVGKIVEVKHDQSRHGKPYVFINFGPWRGHIVKISIWSEGLEALKAKPTKNWEGKWISAVGLMEPPYVSKKYHYSHLSISITQASQLHLIDEKEARFRLAGSCSRESISEKQNSNRKILGSMTGKTGSAINTTVSSGVRGRSNAPTTSNEAILQQMRSSQPTITSGNQSKRQSGYKTPPRLQPPSVSKSNCFIATAVYGIDAPETNAFRQWRDSNLMPNFAGRAIVAIYYIISPSIARIIVKNTNFHAVAKSLLDRIIRFILFSQK